jgi:predicted PurR-regulated permease PerM
MEGKARIDFFWKTIACVLGGAFILYLGKSVFIPLSFALLISFVLYPVCSFFERKRFGRAGSIIIAMTLVTLVISLLVLLAATQVMNLLDEWPGIKVRLGSAITNLMQRVAAANVMTHDQQDLWLSKAGEQIVNSAVMLIRTGFSASISSAVMLIITPVYVVLILYYREKWLNVLCEIMPSTSREQVRTNVRRAVATYYNFIKGMAVVYLVVGILNSIGLLLLGIPHAILLGFTASVLTFIPYFGIMIGAALPVALAWITHDSAWYPIGVIGVFTFVQYLEANIIFPFAVSSRLNVNTLVVLVAIFVGNVIWGVAGMILFVPMVGILKLFTEDNPQLNAITMILKDGK